MSECVCVGVRGCAWVRARVITCSVPQNERVTTSSSPDEEERERERE